MFSNMSNLFHHFARPTMGRADLLSAFFADNNNYANEILGVLWGKGSKFGGFCEEKLRDLWKRCKKNDDL